MRLRAAATAGLGFAIAACAHALPLPALPAPTRDEDAAAGAVIEAHRAEIESCFREASGESAITATPQKFTVVFGAARSSVSDGPASITSREPKVESLARCVSRLAQTWASLRPTYPPLIPTFDLQPELATPGAAVKFSRPLATVNGVELLYDIVTTLVRPRKLSGPDPAYTREALAHRVEGVVKLKCKLDVKGSIRDCQVLQGVPYLTESTIWAISQRSYSPVLVYGEPVEVNYLFNIKFQLP